MGEMFVTPFFAGLVLALLLPLIGLLLRLRDEWLATLGLMHLAAAGALLAMALHLPAFVGALAGAVSGAGAKQASGGRSNSAYGLMILAGWALTLLIAANTRLGEALAHALVDGQLYFAGWRELIEASVVSAIALPAIGWLTPRLIAARFFPEQVHANDALAWRWSVAFDLLAALLIATATTIYGLMATFALIFIPPWIAFQHASDWRGARVLAAGLGVLGYGVAFALAFYFDQPFAPVLIAVLVTSFIFSVRRRSHGTDFSSTSTRSLP